MVSGYRKILTVSMPNLYYLDERPIFDYERLLADAFKRGGKEEEERVQAQLRLQGVQESVAAGEEIN